MGVIEKILIWSVQVLLKNLKFSLVYFPKKIGITETTKCYILQNIILHNKIRVFDNLIRVWLAESQQQKTFCW